MSTATYDVLLYPSAESDLYEIKQYFEQVLKRSPTHLFQKFYDAIEYLEMSGVILFPGQGHGNSPGCTSLLEHSFHEPSSGVLGD
jgi:hypothetical protein